MGDWKLDLYHKTPPLLRTLVASARGYYLRTWRYGSGTDALVEEYLEHETWTIAQWENWQDEKLAFLLHRAATQVPYYRSKWNERRRNGDNSSWEYLENWHILTKDDLRSTPRAFLVEDANLRKMFTEHTSGTSGKPLTLWLNRETVQAWYALFETRWRRWYGISLHDRWGIFGGQLVTPFNKNKPPFWVWNQGLNQLYLSSYHLSPPNIKKYLEAIRSQRLIYLLGYASSLYTLAQMALEQDLEVPSLKLILSNAEPLYEHQREVISKAFHCDVYDTYGQAEYVTAASECSYGNLHLWRELGVTEIFNDNVTEPLESGSVGRIISTGFLNADMPLIRYEVGDRGALGGEDATCCPCGRTLPILSCIEGRNDDLILTPDGRRIGRLDPVFKADLPIREAQIIQETLNIIRVKVVPLDNFGESDIQAIIHRVQQRLGEKVKVVVEPVMEIPRTKAGKFQAVVSMLNKVL